MEPKLWTRGAARWLVLVGVALTAAIVGLRAGAGPGDEVEWLVGDGELVRDRWFGIPNPDDSLHAAWEVLRFRLHEDYDAVLKRLHRLRESGWAVATSEQVESGELGTLYTDEDAFARDARERGVKDVARLPIGYYVQFEDGDRAFLPDRRLPSGVRYSGARLTRSSSSVLGDVREEEFVQVQVVAAEPVGRRGFAPSSEYTTVIVRRIRPPTATEWIGWEIERWWNQLVGTWRLEAR